MRQVFLTEVFSVLMLRYVLPFWDSALAPFEVILKTKRSGRSYEYRSAHPLMLTCADILIRTDAS